LACFRSRKSGANRSVSRVATKKFLWIWRQGSHRIRSRGIEKTPEKRVSEEQLGWKREMDILRRMSIIVKDVPVPILLHVPPPLPRLNHEATARFWYAVSQMFAVPTHFVGRNASLGSPILACFSAKTPLKRVHPVRFLNSTVRSLLGENPLMSTLNGLAQHFPGPTTRHVLSLRVCCF